MQRVLNKFVDVSRVIVRGGRRSEKVESVKVMEKNSITSGTIEPEVWIMSGLLLSLVLQTVGVNLLQRRAEKREIPINFGHQVPKRKKE